MTTPKPVPRELADLLTRASAGEPQIIEGEATCVLISLAEYESLKRHGNAPHPGRWLVENAPRIGDIDLPPRTKDRPVPFDDWTDEEFPE